ncbi:hypothetical protein EG827_00790 [bacterium]|nr:hypothetical protein [bacterium]
MFEREPNIDVVFRNGLKNMEVLPPADVWDNIPPMPVRKSPLRTITGIAAGVAALVSIALFANWYLRSNNPVAPLAEIILAGSGENAVTVDRPVAAADDLNRGLPAAATAVQSTPVEPVSETILTPSTDETKLLLASADPGMLRMKDEETLPVNPGEITVISSRRLTGAANTPAKTATVAAGVETSQRFLVGASVSPSMDFSSAGQDLRLSELMNNEKSRPTYTTGLTFGYKISDRLTIQSGIGISSIGQTVTGVDVFAGLSDFYAVKSSYLYSVETSSGLILAGNTDLFLADSKDRVGSLVQGNMADPSKYPLTLVGDDIQQVFRYLELPLVLRYKLIDSKLGLNLSGGVAYGFLVDNMAYTGEGSDMVEVGHTEGINTHNISSQLGLGMEYNLSSKISFNVEPVFKYYMTPISNISGAFYKPYSLGVYSGFFFKF